LPRAPRPYQLTPALVASSVGVGVLCLAEEGYGRTYRLHAERPGAHLLRRVSRADLPSGAAHVVEPVASKSPLIRVDISGPIEQRAGFHDVCGGWSDGNDAIAERLCAAFAEGDALVYGDTPGGAAAGAQQGVAKALAAKAKYGRRCTGWANEQIGSLGMWWMLALCDELFIPVSGQIGSIGARAGHLSIAGAMAQAGEVVTFFTWPHAGKVALAAELPLSDLGKARGERDVAIIGEAFCAAVVGSAIGQRRGLDRDAVIALGADMLTGEAAIAAGLADAVSTEEDVIAYALRMAERGQTKSSSAQTRARGDRTMPNETTGARVRAEDDPIEPGEDAGLEPSGTCAKCSHANDMNAKFCDQCGASMAAAPVAGEPEDPPPSSRPGQPAAIARLSPAASFAEVLGLPADASVPAQKAKMLDLRQVYDHAAKVTGQRDPAHIIGGLNAISHDAAQSGRLRAERNTIRAKQEVTERWSLCDRLVACGGKPRGDVFKDHVNAEDRARWWTAGR
jgi:ClpP class serine protease